MMLEGKEPCSLYVIRRAYGDTIADTARKMKVSHITYTGWERGTRKMPAGPFIKFAKIYNVNPCDIELPEINYRPYKQN